MEKNNSLCCVALGLVALVVAVLAPAAPAVADGGPDQLEQGETVERSQRADRAVNAEVRTPQGPIEGFVRDLIDWFLHLVPNRPEPEPPPGDPGGDWKPTIDPSGHRAR